MATAVKHMVLFEVGDGSNPVKLTAMVSKLRPLVAPQRCIPGILTERHKKVRRRVKWLHGHLPLQILRSASCLRRQSRRALLRPPPCYEEAAAEAGRGVKLSTDPQSVAARERRHRISHRFKILQSLVPGGSKMDTVSMLEEAIHYVKFLQAQICLHHSIMASSAQEDLAAAFSTPAIAAGAPPSTALAEEVWELKPEAFFPLSKAEEVWGMMERGDPATPETAAPEMDASPSEPSTPLSVAGLLYRYLSDGLCEDCSLALKERVTKLASSGALDAVRMPGGNGLKSPSSFYSAQDSVFSCAGESPSSLMSDGCPSCSPVDSGEGSDSSFVIRRGHAPNYPSPTTSREKGEYGEVPSAKAAPVDCDDLVDEHKMSEENRLSWQQREHGRFSQVRRKKNFVLMERVEGRMVNVLEGLELHTGVFNAREQKKIVECVYSLQKLGEARKLIGRTYSRPKKWMRGKGRVTMQFGCCYNYAVDKDGNPPGIVQDEEVDSLPYVFKMMIKRMVRWHVLPPSCIPNSCIVNIYDEGDCIPPHIDHHDFLRPFCTVSFLSECNILFGSNLKVVGPGEFSGPTAIPLSVGSVLILNGNGADVAKHCVPGVPAKRISITFRKMDDSRLPYKFSADPDLQEIRPLQFSPIRPLQFSPSLYPEKHISDWNQRHILSGHQVLKAQHGTHKSSPLQSNAREEASDSKFHLAYDDFPPLGGSNSTNKPNKVKRST